MKKIIMVLLCLSTIVLTMAQGKKTDEDQIKETVLNYVEGFYTADASRMDKALHPELAKRAIMFNPDGKAFINPMSKSLLVHVTKMQKTRRAPEMNPDQKFNAEIKIFDIDQNCASVKVVTNKFNFFDYIHLVKYNGKWKILNVLWEPY